MSALMRTTDSSRISSKVRKMPGADVQLEGMIGHLRRLRTISRQRFILPVDPIDVMRFEVAGDGCTNGREKRLFAKTCEQSESFQLVFDWILEIGRASCR